MSNTLGAMIGIVRHAFSTTNNAGQTAQIALKFDFRSATDEDIKSWLCGNRAIARQRPMKKLSQAEMLALDGLTVRAEHAGKAIVSRSEQIKAYTSAGVPEAMAIAIIDGKIDDAKLQAIQDILTTTDNEDSE